MADLVFFYGTLMTPFNRTARLQIDDYLVFRGRGTIAAALFDLGIYPAAVPDGDSRVCGEIYEMLQPATVLRALDELEGYRPSDPETSHHRRGRLRRGLGLLLQCPARSRGAYRLRRLSGVSEGQVAWRCSFTASRKAAIAVRTRSDGSMNSIPER